MITDDVLVKYGVVGALIIQLAIFFAYQRFKDKARDIADAKKDKKYMELFKTFMERDETRNDKYDIALNNNTEAMKDLQVSMNNVRAELIRRS